jgi:hypothetical protein
MKRPPDIAQDAWFAALKAVGDELERDHEGFHATEAAINSLVIAGARAILAERERCALVAENSNAWPQEGADIAHAIRNPSTPADPPRGDNISPSPLGDAGNDDFKRVPVIGEVS